MLKPPDPITKTFFKSIGFEAFFKAPSSMNLFEVVAGSGCCSALRIELENRRIWYCAVFSTGLWAFASRVLVEVRVLNARGADAEARHWRRSADVRPVRRPDRAIAPGAVSQKLIEKRDLVVYEAGRFVAPVAQKISHWRWPWLRSCIVLGEFVTLNRRSPKYLMVGLTGYSLSH